MEVIPLEEYFRIIVLENGDKKISNNKSCFNFELLKNKAYRIADLQAQIDEIAKFLAEFHAYSFGKQMSLLFPIKQVSLCSKSVNKGRALQFKNRVLHIGIIPSRHGIKSSQKLLEEWNKGSAVKPEVDFSLTHLTPFMGDKLRMKSILDTQGMRGLLMDKVSKYWDLLNPIGDMRFSARAILMSDIASMSSRIAKRLERDLDKDDKGSVNPYAKRMLAVAKGPGFSEEEREFLRSYKDDIDIMEGIFQSWIEAMRDPKLIGQVMEKAIIEKDSSNSQTTILARKIWFSLITVLNHHDVTVELQHLFQTDSTLSVSDFLSNKREKLDQRKVLINTEEGIVDVHDNGKANLTINTNQVYASLLVVDTGDNVNVDIQLPKMQTGTLSRIALFKVVRELMDNPALL